MSDAIRIVLRFGQAVFDDEDTVRGILRQREANDVIDRLLNGLQGTLA